MDITRDALEYLASIGEDSKVVEIADNGESIVVGVAQGGGGYDVALYPKPPIERKHYFRSLDGFMDFVNSDRSPTNGVIFIGDDDVYADLAYGEHVRQCARLSLAHSNERKALDVLALGVTQKELWRLLVNELNGCVDPGIELIISSINVKTNQEASIQINRLGTESGESKRQVEITYPEAKGGASAKRSIPETIAWHGRIFECFQEEFVIDLRVEVSESLEFVLHPMRLERMEREARARLVAEIRTRIAAEKQWLIVEGEYSA